MSFETVNEIIPRLIQDVEDGVRYKEKHGEGLSYSYGLSVEETANGFRLKRSDIDHWFKVGVSLAGRKVPNEKMLHLLVLVDPFSDDWVHDAEDNHLYLKVTATHTRYKYKCKHCGHDRPDIKCGCASRDGNVRSVFEETNQFPPPETSRRYEKGGGPKPVWKKRRFDVTQDDWDEAVGKIVRKFREWLDRETSPN
ncbi:MAG: hypothetical protein ISN29_08885 [Gammaproteobacteria bacterium AqS3]|nr:hypothetical protein [Gammaproteobacteria bacterium AqS3]